MRVTCSRCSKEHDLEAMEPGHGLPDVVFRLSEYERRVRVIASKDICQWRRLSGGMNDSSAWLNYLRVLLEFRVEGRLAPCRWGVWVEVEQPSFYHVIDLWDAPERVADKYAWKCTLANELMGYPKSFGLSGSLRFRNLTDVPYLTLDDGEHPLITEQRGGVSQARAVEWLVRIHHGETA